MDYISYLEELDNQVQDIVEETWFIYELYQQKEAITDAALLERLEDAYFFVMNANQIYSDNYSGEFPADVMSRRAKDLVDISDREIRNIEELIRDICRHPGLITRVDLILGNRIHQRCV